MWLAIQAIRLLLRLFKIRRMVYTVLNVLCCETSGYRFHVIILLLVNALSIRVRGFAEGFLAGQLWLTTQHLLQFQGATSMTAKGFTSWSVVLRIYEYERWSIFVDRKLMLLRCEKGCLQLLHLHRAQLLLRFYYLRTHGRGVFSNHFYLNGFGSLIDKRYFLVLFLKFLSLSVFLDKPHISICTAHPVLLSDVMIAYPDIIHF